MQVEHHYSLCFGVCSNISNLLICYVYSDILHAHSLNRTENLSILLVFAVVVVVCSCCWCPRWPSKMPSSTSTFFPVAFKPPSLSIFHMNLLLEVLHRRKIEIGAYWLGFGKKNVWLSVPICTKLLYGMFRTYTNNKSLWIKQQQTHIVDAMRGNKSDAEKKTPNVHMNR